MNNKKKGKAEMPVLSLLARIRLVGRLPVANAIGMRYSTFANKLNGYCPMTDDEKKRVEKAVGQLERKRAA